MAEKEERGRRGAVAPSGAAPRDGGGGARDDGRTRIFVHVFDALSELVRLLPGFRGGEHGVRYGDDSPEFLAFLLVAIILAGRFGHFPADDYLVNRLLRMGVAKHGDAGGEEDPRVSVPR